jgi:type IV pilus biogenesis protein CpaD/CtpE
MKITWRCIALSWAFIGFVAVLAGCATTDPLLNPDDWHPTGANALNIAAEIAKPADLVRGREAAGGSDGQMAAAAILRLRTGHVKALPDSGLTDLQVQSAPAAAGGP